ncbi:MAG: endonuclease/exonuclease/phosphatase family protein [Gemmatimonadales bacterium]
MQRIALLLTFAAVAGCRTGRNYPTPDGPRYAGEPGHSRAGNRHGADTLRVVSFNIEFSQQVDSAISLLAGESSLRDADVLLLQVVNEQATRRIAEALGLSYVYYPAIFRYRTDRHMGNAVLSRWPIVEDRKIVLPHVSRIVGTQRTATAATIRVGDLLVRVYSTHLGTMGDLAPAARRDQLRAILADAERGPGTTWFGRLDHIFLNGIAAPDSGAAAPCSRWAAQATIWPYGPLEFSAEQGLATVSPQRHRGIAQESESSIAGPDICPILIVTTI